MKKKKAVCFDMFFTLVDPHRELEHLEYDNTGLTAEEWAKAVWCDEVSPKGGLGILKTPEEIIEKICEQLPVELTPEQCRIAKEGKLQRLKIALTEIDSKILNVLKGLKERGYKIGIISNADAFDIYHWEKSPLKEYVDDAIFSCNVGLLKPSREIFELSLKHLGVTADDAFFVGDGDSNEHLGAKELGFTTIWTEYLWQWDENKRRKIKESADFHVTDFMEILDIVDGMAEAQRQDNDL